MKNNLFVVAALLLMIGACRSPEKQITNEDTNMSNDTACGLVVADTIIYEVIIRNSNADDPWVVHCLKGLNYSMLIDSIFNMVYSGRVMAYNHETGEKLTPRQVEKIESGKGFDRDNISMIQFTEVWYLNSDRITFTKKVLSMVLGYDYYTSDGELIGHKALFRVEMQRKK